MHVCLSVQLLQHSWDTHAINIRAWKSKSANNRPLQYTRLLTSSLWSEEELMWNPDVLFPHCCAHTDFVCFFSCRFLMTRTFSSHAISQTCLQHTAVTCLFLVSASRGRLHAWRIGIVWKRKKSVWLVDLKSWSKTSVLNIVTHLPDHDAFLYQNILM